MDIVLLAICLKKKIIQKNNNLALPPGNAQ